MPQYGTVTGSFFTQEKVGAAPYPLRGRINFVPLREVREQGSYFGRAEVVAEIQGGVLRRESGDPGLTLVAGSWQVVPNLRDGRGIPVAWAPFSIVVPANGVLDVVTGATIFEATPPDSSPSDDTGGWSVLDHGDGTGEIIPTHKE